MSRMAQKTVPKQEVPTAEKQTTAPQNQPPTQQTSGWPDAKKLQELKDMGFDIRQNWRQKYTSSWPKKI